MPATSHKGTDSRFLIGIDLGTTRCALAYLDRRSEASGIKLFGISQLVDEGQIEARETLPSVLFLPEDPAAVALPDWLDPKRPLTGAYAADLGFQVPGRFVHSAKAWLCHARMDRSAPILPLQSTLVTDKLSPVQATCCLLEHLIRAWDMRMAAGDPAATLVRQQVIVTVPASFDPVARNLTLQAINDAGIPDVLLLEEPQAAFYDYLYRNPKQMRRDLAKVQTVLVVDIGGGTTDFSLIGVTWPETGDHPSFSRLAVGPHLLIGGDNLDLAVAHLVDKAFRHKGRKLVSRQWLSILHQSRAVKEELLSGTSTAESFRFTVSGAGSRVLARTLHEDIPAPQILDMILDGYFPQVAVDERPDKDQSLGLSEAGLPFTRDPAITRHLAEFLAEQDVLPDAILFNGGTMASPILQERLLEVISRWRERAGAKKPLKMLKNPRPALAVSAGATYLGMVRAGMGHRIESGNPVSIYVGIGTDDEAEHLGHVPKQLMCLLPRGSATETWIQVPDKTFGIDTGRKTAFYLYFTAAPPRNEGLGDLRAYDAGRFSDLPPSVLDAASPGGIQHVEIQVRLRETGLLEVRCHGVEDDQLHELHFDLSQPGAKSAAGRKAGGAKKSEACLDAGQDKAISALVKKLAGLPAKQAPFNGLFNGLEDILSTRRNDWPLATLRWLFDRFVGEAKLQSDDQALIIYFRLLGFCLRPGCGAAGDEERLNRLWATLEDRSFSGNTALWAEWWTLWKRVAPGLAPARQQQLLTLIEPLLFPPKRPGKEQRLADPHERKQLWRLVGHLERLPTGEKERIGSWILQAPATFGTDLLALYALGRLGARDLSYAGAQCLVSQDAANRWTAALLKRGTQGSSYQDWALRELARKTGDRLTQIDDVLRKQVLELLKKKARKKSFLEPVLKVQPLKQEDYAEYGGEQLPSGLVWVKDDSAA